MSENLTLGHVWQRETTCLFLLSGVERRGAAGIGQRGLKPGIINGFKDVAQAQLVAVVCDIGRRREQIYACLSVF